MARIGIRPITPSRPLFNQAVFERALTTTANRYSQVLLKDYQSITATWRRKPNFVRIVTKGDELVVEVSTTDEIFGYVTGGTRPHVIRPKRAPRLRFATGYTAKTKPGVVGSGGGGASGPIVFAKKVQHPGTKAREFEKTIIKGRGPEFVESVQADVRRAVR